MQEMNLLKNNIRSFIKVSEERGTREGKRQTKYKSFLPSKRHRIVDFHAFVFTKGHEFKRIDMFRYVGE